MTRVLLVFLPLLALPLGGGCTNTCSNACNHIATLCAEDFARQSRVLDTNACTENCKANLSGCSNISDQVKCSMEVQTCDDLKTCPSCF
jgi:hypothetical protein